MNFEIGEIVKYWDQPQEYKSFSNGTPLRIVGKIENYPLPGVLVCKINCCCHLNYYSLREYCSSVLIKNIKKLKQDIICR